MIDILYLLNMKFSKAYKLYVAFYSVPNILTIIIYTFNSMKKIEKEYTVDKTRKKPSDNICLGSDNK